MTQAVRHGAICYLAEVVEVRKDTTVVIHPLADDRRQLAIEKRGELLIAPKEFMLAVSYNPGYQSVLKDMKQSTRQRFVALELNYPGSELETEIICHEAGVEEQLTRFLLRIAAMTRGLKDSGLREGASTRLRVHAGLLMREGIARREACHVTISEVLMDDHELVGAIDEMISSVV